MFAIDQNKIAGASVLTLKELRDAVLAWLAGVDDRFGLRRFFGWLRGEAGRNATLEELDRLNDHCLCDMGIKRSPRQRTDDLVRLLRAGG